MKYSAGIIPFRIVNGKMEFFVGHPGGVSWQNRNYWAYLKGCVEKGEDWVTAAIREFKEESGLSMEDCRSNMLIPLGTSLQNPKKTVIAYGIEYPNIDPNDCHSNIADNGLNPEIDQYRWMDYDTLSKCTHAKHLVFYEQLIAMNRDND